MLVDDGLTSPVPTTIERDKAIGIDVGLSQFLTDSDGNEIHNPRFLKSSLINLARAQRKLSRCKKGSANRAKQKIKVAAIHEKVANQRHGFIHQVSAQLAVKNHATTIAVENLNIKGMVKNRKLARAIQDVGWGMFLSALEYKCQMTVENEQPDNPYQTDCPKGELA